MPDAMSYEAFTVAVDGGELRVGKWGDSGPVVLAAHGITATHRSMAALADQLGHEMTVVAPDLRGRGRSETVTGPYSMAAHADDCGRVLDHLGVDAADVMVGHSMGGFVAVVTAHRHPERVRRVVLVDGGLPLPGITVPEGVAIEDLVRSVIGPALDRLRMTFPSVDAYLDFWRAHPALAHDWSHYVVDAYTYDLTGTAPELRPGVSEAAVLADAESQLVRDDIPLALDSFTHPVTLLLAPKGMAGTEPGLYPEAAVDEWRSRLPQLRVEVVPGVNHYTILLGEPGAAAVAATVRSLLAS